MITIEIKAIVRIWVEKTNITKTAFLFCKGTALWKESKNKYAKWVCIIKQCAHKSMKPQNLFKGTCTV